MKSADDNSSDEFNFEKAIADYEKDLLSTIELSLGETKEIFIFTNFTDDGCPCYSSDESVVVIDSDANVTAVDEGTAYVAVVAHTGMYVIRKINVTDDSFNISRILNVDAGTIAFSIFFVVILALAIGTTVELFVFSKSTMVKRNLPARRVTQNTIKSGQPDRKYCEKCGKEFGEAEYCPQCGNSRKVKSRYVFPINGRMQTVEFEKILNQWFAENPYIYNCRVTLDTRESLFNPFVKYKFYVKNAVVEYNVSDKPQRRQYGFAFLFKFRFIPFGYSSEKHIAEWQNNNPDCEIVSLSGGKIHYYSNGGSNGTEYYKYVVFRK